MIGRPPVDPLVRFLEKVQVDPSTGCWLWTGAVNNGGYSRLWNEGRTVLGHRFAYERLVGPIPEGLQIDHLCAVRHCVNPIHLEPVTCRENLLRGDTVNARNAAKTHCARGHPFDSANTKRLPDRSRYCVTCHKQSAQRSRDLRGTART